MKKIGIALVLLICLGSVFLILKRPRQAEALTYTVKRGALVRAVYGIGTVTAKKTYQIKVGVNSTLTHIYVQEGDKVKAGAPLLALDNNPVFAPFMGTVTAIPFKTGETVYPQTSLLTLTDLTDRYITVSLEQEASLQVQKGQKAVLNFESLRNKKFEGVVTAVFSNEGQFWVHIKGLSLPDFVLPGMTADVAIEIEHKTHCLVIPITALLPPSVDKDKANNPSEKKVQRLVQGKKVETPVILGTVDADAAEVVSGLQEGDLVELKGK